LERPVAALEKKAASKFNAAMTIKNKTIQVTVKNVSTSLFLPFLTSCLPLSSAHE
jgi:hypothetical protein